MCAPGTGQGSDPAEEQGQVGGTELGAQDRRGRCPAGLLACPHPLQMQLAASRAEAQPRHSGLPVGAAGVCGGSFDPRVLPGEGHLPAGFGRTEHPLAWSHFPQYSSVLKLLD